MTLDELRRQIDVLDPITHRNLRGWLITRYDRLTNVRGEQAKTENLAEEMNASQMTAHEEESRLEDPRRAHEKVFAYIVAAVQAQERDLGHTWAEILCEVEAVAPQVAKAYYEAHEAADCDVYGLWKTGTLSQGGFDEFKSALATWKQATLGLLEFRRKMSSTSQTELG